MIKLLLVIALFFALALNVTAIVEIIAFNSVRSLAAANIVNCGYWLFRKDFELAE